MKIFLWMALLALTSSAVANDDHDAIRHRQLKCIKKGFGCGHDPNNCCGKSKCGADFFCCIPDGSKGCDANADCCGGLTCTDSLCGEADGDDVTGGRQCGIHGEECTVDNTGGGNSCCGNQKYLCEEVQDLEGIRCCMPLGGKGCSSNSHCCGSLDFDAGNVCSEESRCVDSYGNYPDDAPGGRNCLLKGEECESAAECCGSQKYDCNGKCCIKDGNNGCEGNEDCCSNNCDTGASLCVAS